MQLLFHANKSHFHKNGFALRLALKQRHKELGNGLLAIGAGTAFVADYCSCVKGSCTQ